MYFEAVIHNLVASRSISKGTYALQFDVYSHYTIVCNIHGTVVHTPWLLLTLQFLYEIRAM